MNTTETLKAIAIASGYANSEVASVSYTINLTAETPAFSVPGGTYTSAQTVTITDATANASIYYTTNGSTPTTSSILYTGPITVSSSETLQAVAALTGYYNSPVASASYTINIPVLPTPVFSLAAGTYSSSQTVSITDSNAQATIYYTTNGSTPTTSSTLYTGVITVSATETVSAIAVASGYTNSAMASALYTINLPQLPAPVLSVVGGTYTSVQSVGMTDSNAQAAIHYTKDGSTPTASSTLYTGPITVGVSETVEALAVESGYSNSPVSSASYVINLPTATPTFSVGSGTYTTIQTVAILDATANATIYYTTNGATPTISSTLYTGVLTVSTTETLQAIAVAQGYTTSAVASATYTMNLPPLPAPTFSIPGGMYTTAQTVSINESNGQAAIYYTTNGSTPTTSSSIYNGQITVSTTETLKAIAVATGYSRSDVAIASYTINLTAATPTFSVAGGIYTSA